MVKASDEDLAWLYPDRPPAATLAAWLELGPAIVAMTRGAAGPVLLSRNVKVELAAEPVAVADTVGAGGLLYGGAHLRPGSARSTWRCRPGTAACPDRGGPAGARRLRQPCRGRPPNGSRRRVAATPAPVPPAGIVGIVW
ncbi:hypothetical protein PY310_16485 [Pseudarthrobacter sp. H3Y2-7]|uniref:hypothetical protein n=1 Tax=Pseudarthrobacter naphthalenicus TaxID=3031328 RepID=UPI0023B12992|nr:hypothetical protein [Pseudarthrobacter sp. H3Y2-7]MDE8670179.1 hypothetical protein [Pseudarthrobacter sp. H3Y2-7]